MERLSTGLMGLLEAAKRIAEKSTHPLEVQVASWSAADDAAALIVEVDRRRAPM
jgi:hypothetical protein